MRKFAYSAALLCLLWAGSSLGQEMSRRLSNQDIIDMVALGLSDDVIIAKIRSANGQDQLAFDTSVAGLKNLKASKVPDDVIKVMINPAPLPVAIAGGTSPSVADPNFPPPEVGVYWRDGATFVRIEGEALSQAKVGGRAGSFFTYGMRSEHWDAYIEGPTSKNHVKDRRPSLYFYVPEGLSSSDFVLIKLEKKSDRREFQVGSFGGVTAGKSGVKRDKEIPFKSKHVAIRTFKITLDSDLKPGEYAFFMGTGQQVMMAGGHGSNSSGGSATGRIYDFSVPE
jgi:hypothetical protein